MFVRKIINSINKIAKKWNENFRADIVYYSVYIMLTFYDDGFSLKYSWNSSIFFKKFRFLFCLDFLNAPLSVRACSVLYLNAIRD